MVSLTVVISTAIATAAMVAAIAAFTPTYIASVESVTDTVNDLRQNIIVKARIGAEQFMLTPINSISNLANAHKLGLFDMAQASDDAKIRLTCDYVNNIRGVLSAEYVTPYVPDADVFKTLCDGRATIPPVILQNSSMYFYMYYQDDITGLQNWSNPYAPAPFVTIPKFYNQLNTTAQHYLQAGNGSAMWLPATYGSNSVEFRAGFSFKDRYGQPGAFFVRLLPKALQQLLASLELRSRARCLIVDSNSKFVVAVNWNESTEVLFENYNNLRLPGPQRMLLKTVSDFNDTLINDVVSHFGGATGFFSQPSPSSHEMGKGRDHVFINIENITDKFGLDMRILLAMPELDFMEDAYKSRDMTIGIVVASMALMIAFAILFSIAITRPIDRIGLRMYKTAALQDEDDDDPPSLLSEVRGMQEAYATMKQELNRLKSYLPQSVLCADVGDDDDEEEEAASATASGHKSSNKSSSHKSSERASVSRSKVASDSRTILSSNGKNGVAVTALNTSTGVVQKRVVVVVFNLQNFLSEAGNGANTDRLTKIQSEFLTLVNRVSRDSRGVVDSFQGDHVVVTFNAVNNVACPSKRASVVALTVCKEAAESSLLPKVSVGLAYGAAVVGNTGSSEMQRFNIIGPVYQRALAIERLAAHTLRKNPNLPFVILCNSAVMSEINVDFYYQIVDVAILPCQKNKGDAQQQRGDRIVHIAQMKSTVQSEEWMYELEESEKGDPFAKINAIFEALCVDGDEDLAKELLDARSGEVTVGVAPPDALGIARAKELLLSGGSPTALTLL